MPRKLGGGSKQFTALKLTFHISCTICANFCDNSQEYANKVYNAVKDVSNLICGNFWSKCSRDDLFSFMGKMTYNG